MKKVLTLLLMTSTLLVSGCKAETPLNIEFNYFTPTAYVGEEYNFTEVLNVEKGVQYKLDVYVCDYLTMTEKVLEVKNNFYFTPLEKFDLSVVVTATKGGQKVVKTKPVPVSIKGDPIDELLVTGGYSGYSDSGISKELVTDEVYLKGENSKSAIYASFQNANLYTWGAAIMSLNNFRLLEYWSDKVWENAVVHFWVYNPNEEALEFQLRIADDYTKMVDVDWGNSLNPRRIAAPGEWTEILFSLRRYGVDHTLYENEDGSRRDSLNVKIKYHGASKTFGEAYSYQLYIDDVDIIPYSKERFPDLDTKCYAKNETLEYGWENMFLDQGWTSSNVYYDRDFVNNSEDQESKSSMHLTFNDVSPEKDNGYAVILSPEEQFQDEDEKPSLRHGLLDLDIHYSSDVTDKSIMIIAVQEDWTFTIRYNFNPEATTNEWMHLTIDFAFYSAFDSVSNCIRLGFGFTGINASNKDTAVIHIDNIKFDQDGGTPEKIKETLANGWENMVLDIGWTSANTEFDYSLVNSDEQHQSTSSMTLTFNNVEAERDNGYAVILCPEEQFIDKDERPSLRHGLLDLDIHYSSDITDKSIKVIAVQEDWTSTIRYNFTPENTSNEWMHLTIDFATYPVFDSVDSCIRLGFGFVGINSSNKDTAVVHIDNIKFNQDGGTPEKIKETIAEGWENMPLDSGWTTANIEFDYDAVNSTDQHSSTSSMVLTFANVDPDPNNGYAVIFQPEELSHLNEGVMEFDVKFSDNVTNNIIKIIATDTEWNTARLDIEPADAGGEWIHYSIDFTTISEFSSISSCIRLGIGFNGVTSSTKNNAVIHLDNFFFYEKD